MTNTDIKREAGAVFGYGLLAVLFLLPLSLHPANTVAYVGDGLGSVYFVSETASHLVHNPGHLFDAGVAFPHAHASLFEAHRLLIALLAAPFLLVTGNPVLATNLVTLLAYVFNAWSARRLARRLGLSPLPAFAAGCLFAFNTYALNEEPRLNVIFLGFLPLALGSFLDFLQTGARSKVWQAGFFLLMEGYAENYYAVYGVVLLGLVLALHLVLRPRLTAPRLRGLFLPGLVTGVLFLPMIAVYADMDRQFDYRREAPQTLDLDHYFAPSAGNLLYGSLGRTVRSQQLGPHFVGFGALFLAALALVAALLKRGAGREEPSLLPPSIWVPGAFVLAVAFLLLSVGRDVQWSGVRLLPGPFGFLYDHVALFQRLRIPERLSLFVMMFVALLAARGVMLMPGKSLQLVLCLLLPLEHLSTMTNWARVPVGDDIPPVYHFLQSDSARAVAEVPIHGEGLVRMESLEMYYSLFHQKPITAAYLSFAPLLTAILRRILGKFPSRKTLDALRRVGVDTVVVHEGREGGQSMNREILDQPERSELKHLATFPNLASVLTESGKDLGDHGTDMVYRIEPRPLEAPAPFPPGSRVADPRWLYRSSAGAARGLGDGDPDTGWAIEDPLKGGESVEVTFRDQTVVVSGVALPLTRRQMLPSSFAVLGRTPTGEWRELAEFDDAHERQLIDGLLSSPGRARLGFAFDAGPQPLSGVRLLALPGARSFDGWRLSEIEILTTQPQVR